MKGNVCKVHSLNSNVKNINYSFDVDINHLNYLHNQIFTQVELEILQ
jgi:hypothetical protein